MDGRDDGSGAAHASRLVVVANRVPAQESPGGPLSVGGLVSAVRPALEELGGLWFGWSGREGDPAGPLGTWSAAGVDYVTLDLDRHEIEHYYEGFCNSALWPLMHGLPERSHVDPADYDVWIEVNARFAERLLPLLRPGDRVWVHDYHLIPLGAELRARGWDGAIGYFHHIPIPDEEHWALIPRADEVARAFTAYGLVGLQTDRDRLRLAAYVPRPGPLFATLPIGIDTRRVRELAAAHKGDPFADLRRGRQVVFGLDRLDYSKAVPARIEAFADLLDANPAIADQAVFAQWSAPSREGIAEYQAERRAVEEAARRVRLAAHAEDAMELRIEVLPPELVFAALREADVCLVTSVVDGMNLVAKEYVAAHDEANPGVLVLTDGCGAAEQLTDALIVPSSDTPALSRAIVAALAMPSEERARRWRVLSERVESVDASSWCDRFVQILEHAEEARNTAP